MQAETTPPNNMMTCLLFKNNDDLAMRIQKRSLFHGCTSNTITLKTLDFLNFFKLILPTCNKMSANGFQYVKMSSCRFNIQCKKRLGLE